VHVTFCGVRGSTPSPGPDFARYGGNTSCVAVGHSSSSRPVLLLDAGTGLSKVTPLLGGQAFAGTIALTHLHWDHSLGLPFFRGGDDPDARVSLLLPDQQDGSDAESLLARVMTPPFFPIEPGQLRGEWTFGTLSPPRGGAAEFKAEGFGVEAREIPHKGGRTFGYRVSDGHRVLAYVTDHCPTALGPGPDGLGAYHEAALALAEGADVLIHDAQIVAEEIAAEAYFGHAAAEYAVALAARAGARHVVLFHHKPSRTDSELDAIAARFASSAIPVTVAAEGLTLDFLPSPPATRTSARLLLLARQMPSSATPAPRPATPARAPRLLLLSVGCHLRSKPSKG
jgi:phosphoribosyl 1,2-cyclic phosphodiesterase